MVRNGMHSVLDKRILYKRPLSASMPSRTPVRREKRGLCLPVPCTGQYGIAVRSPSLGVAPRKGVRDGAVMCCTVGCHACASPIGIVSFSTGRLGGGTQLVTTIGGGLSRKAPNVSAPLTKERDALGLTTSLTPNRDHDFAVSNSHTVHHLSVQVSTSSHHRTLHSAILSVTFSKRLAI